ncbi:MAG: DUF4145 domain-containing protein [Candidatus Electrothrix sp. AR4]|nr:DUF4145 domain-containing protein [Candidatus Electrothrix sp. AR4]
MSEDHTIRGIAFCPHCGNRAPQKLVYSKHFYSYSLSLKGDRTGNDLPAAYFVAECETCHEVLVYLSESNIPEDKQFPDSGLIWPNSGFLGQGVPELIKEIYNEAIIIKNLAPNSFAVQIRRSLEVLCDDRGARKGALHDRLKALVDKNEIPHVLSEMSDIIGLIESIGIHASQQHVKPGHVRVIDEFFRAVIEYVYVAPQKIKQLKEQLHLMDGDKKLLSGQNLLIHSARPSTSDA